MTLFGGATMTLLDNRVSDLIAGYNLVYHAESQIKNKWRTRLLKAYAQQRAQYDIVRTAYQERFRGFKFNALTGYIFIGGGLIVALLMAIVSGLVNKIEIARGLRTAAIYLGAAGISVGLVLAAIWLWLAKFNVPQPPQHPLKSNLVKSPYPAWQKALKGKLPDKLETQGARGEHNFVRRMAHELGSSHFIIYRLQQKQGDDIDVTIVGPTGIWVFEVKYWSGTIKWDNGQWKRIQPNNPHPIINQPPDEQWQRMAADVAKTIRIQAPQLPARFLNAIGIKGGIAFTLPSARIDISPGLPVQWGTMIDWVKRLKTTPQIPGWDDSVTFTVLDALLKRHHQVLSTTNNRSMETTARSLMQQMEKDLQSWINISAKPN